MKATRLHIGTVISEMKKGVIDEKTLKLAKKRSKNIDRIILAFYLILRAEEISELEIKTTKE
tara:strand:- start:37781 stop:37966 length:186 start_codon:yes stop_codon:yes gene_type:complete